MPKFSSLLAYCFCLIIANQFTANHVLCFTWLALSVIDLVGSLAVLLAAYGIYFYLTVQPHPTTSQHPL